MATIQDAMVAVKGPSLELRKADAPKPNSGEVLVKIHYVAQNPTDVQSFDSEAFGDGAVYGCDFVGEVVETGSSVTRLSNHDVIAGLIWGGERKGIGAYSSYTLADERICFKVPQEVSYGAASTVPLAAATAWLALFSKGCLNIKRGSGTTLLIWGGSSSVGQYAIQLAKLQGLKVITTCGQRNFDLVKRTGADHVFDYRAPTVVEDIQNVEGSLCYVFDTIGNESSSALAAAATSGSAVLCTVRPGKANTGDVPSRVRVTDVLVWTAFLKEHRYGKFHWPASDEDHELSAELFEQLTDWLVSGKLVPNRFSLLKGLQAVPEGFEMYRKGKISAQKLVYDLGVASA